MESPDSFVHFSPHEILAQAVQDAKEELLKGNPERNKPWFVMGCHYLLPLCKAKNNAQTKAFANRTEDNKRRLRETNSALLRGVRHAKNAWAEHLAIIASNYRKDPVNSWKAVKLLNQGLSNHHTANRKIRMYKEDGKKATSDEENAKIFATHFEKIFNNPSPLPCDLSILDEIENSPELSHLAEEPLPEEIRAAIKRMTNGKATGFSGLSQDALKAMIFVDGESDSQDSEFISNYVHEILTSFWRGKKI
jgi:hypothetical protein